MVEQGRSADRDTDSVRGKTPLQGGSEKRISPRNISAEHQYVRVETGKDRTRELRQLFAVDVEKTARSRIGVVPGGDLPRTGQGLAGQLFVTDTKPDPTPVPSVRATTRRASHAAPPRHSPSAKAEASLT